MSFDEAIDVNKELVVQNPKSVFVLANSKIEIETIYDNQATIGKTRFGNLPTKYDKKNLPVTFNKQIKSSGYGSAPGSLKYISKEKKKKEEQKSGVSWTISRDFYSKPIPLSIQSDVSILNEKQMSLTALNRLKFSPFGTKLACATVDAKILVLKTPIYQNALEVTNLLMHNYQINSLHWSSND